MNGTRSENEMKMRFLMKQDMGIYAGVRRDDEVEICIVSSWGEMMNHEFIIFLKHRVMITSGKYQHFFILGTINKNGKAKGLVTGLLRYNVILRSVYLFFQFIHIIQCKV